MPARRMAAFLAVLFAVLAGCGESPAVEPTEPPEDSGKPTIVLADNFFESLAVNNAIARFIIEHGYRNPVETVKLPAAQLQDGLAEGAVDVWLELWQQNWREKFNREVAAGRIEELGQIYEGGEQFWVVPREFGRAFRIETVDDLKRPDVVSAIAKVTGTERPLFHSCIAAWDCDSLNRAKLAGYGLADLYDPVVPGTAKEMERSLVKAQTDRDPFLGFYWAPTSVMGRFEWRIIREPRFTSQCWRELTRFAVEPQRVPREACAYQTAPVVKGAHSALRTKAPDVVTFLEKMDVGVHPLNVTLAWAAANEIDTELQWEQVAAQFMRTFDAKWRSWVPARVAERVEAALKEI